jgi:hypothetical protein
MWKDISFHLFHGPHSGYTAILLGAILLLVGACFDDVFIDESESAPSEIATERRAFKATKTTRPIMIAITSAMIAFAIWKISQP